MSRSDEYRARLRHARHPCREHATGRSPGRQLGAHLPVGDLRGGGRRGAGRHPRRPASGLRLRTIGQSHRGGHGGCLRAAARRARRVRVRVRHGGHPRRAAVAAAGRRPGRVDAGRVRQHPDAAVVRAGALRGGCRVRRCHGPRRRRGGPPDAHPGAVSRDHRQPDHRRRRPGGPRRAGPSSWRRGHRGQHVRIALPVPALRAGCRPGRRIDHQVGRRSLGRAGGRGGRPGRPHRPGPRDRDRDGRHDRPVRGVPGAAGHGDPARAHGPPRVQRPGPGPVARGAPGGAPGDLPGPRFAPPGGRGPSRAAQRRWPDGRRPG